MSGFQRIGDALRGQNIKTLEGTMKALKSLSEVCIRIKGARFQKTVKLVQVYDWGVQVLSLTIVGDDHQYLEELIPWHRITSLEFKPLYAPKS
ncbi:MAG: hypothetical protein ACK5Y6_05590 [Pseudomonadota bacterium]